MAWWDDPEVQRYVRAKSGQSGRSDPTPALSSSGVGVRRREPAPTVSFFEDPGGNLRQGLRYFEQDVGQHFGKPFPEAATGVAGALLNAGLDTLSFIPREVSPVAVGAIATGQDPLTANPTRLKRAGEDVREGVVESLAVPDFDIGPLEIRLDTLPAEILYDTVTDPTIWVAGLGLIPKLAGATGLAKAMQYTAIAPGLPLIAPIKGMGAALKASGLTKLSKRGENYYRSLAADRTTKELNAHFEDVLPGLPDVKLHKGWLSDTYLGVDMPLSSQGRKYLEQEHIRPVADRFFRTFEGRFDENARQSLLADIGRAEQKALGLNDSDAGFGPQKLWDGMNRLWKEVWLPLNPSYHAANTIDNTVKSLLYGLLPFRHRNLAESLGLGKGIERTHGFGLTITQIPEGKGILPFTSVGTKTSETIESFFRVMAYNKSLGDDWTGIRNSFLVDAERQLISVGVDPAKVQALVRQLRHMDFSGKDFIDEVRHILGDDLPSHIKLGDVDFPGYEGLIRNLRADLKACTANLDDYLRRADEQAESVRQAFANRPDYGTGQAFGRSVRDMLKAAEEFPDGTAALQVLMTVREMGRIHQILADAARALPKSEQVMGWNHFRDLTDELGQLGQDAATAIRANADLSATHGPLADDIAQTSRAVQESILKHAAWARTKAAWDEMGDSYGAAKREKDRRIFEEVGALISGFVSRHKNTWAEFENLTHMTDFNVLKQYGEGMEALVGRKMGERAGHLDDATEIAEDFKEWLTLKFQGLGAVTGSTAKALDKDVGKVVRELSSELQSEINKMDDRAIKFTGDVFFNYGARTNLDGLLSVLSPFTVWQTRNIPWYIQHLAASPGGRSLTKQIRDYVEETEGEREERGLTRRFERTARIGEIDGTELRADVTKPVLSAATQVDQPFILRGGDEPAEGEERLGPQGATPVGAAIQTFLRLMGGISLYPQIYLPLQAAGTFGEVPVQDILPASRAVRGASELLFNAPPPGILDPERNIFQRGVRSVGQALADADIPFIPGVEQTSVTGNIFIDEQIRRRIAEKGRERGLDEPTLLRAMNDSEGQLWQEAQREVQRESNLTAGARFLAPVSVKTLSPGEQDIRAAYRRLPRKPAGMPYKQWEETDEWETRNEMLDADPGLSAYLDRFDSPAARELTALMDEFYKLGDPAAIERLNATEPQSEERTNLYNTDPEVAEVRRLRDKFKEDHSPVQDYFERDRKATPGLRDYVAQVLAQTPAQGDEGPVERVQRAGLPAAEAQGVRNQLNAEQAQYRALKHPQHARYFDLPPNSPLRTQFRENNPAIYEAIIQGVRARHQFNLENPLSAQYFMYWNERGWAAQKDDERTSYGEFIKAWREGKVPDEDQARKYVEDKIAKGAEIDAQRAARRPKVRQFRPSERPRIFRR